MFNLSKLYQPITASPARTREFLPSKALRPYIRCYWDNPSFMEHAPEPLLIAEGNPDPTVGRELIIPDTCMDIIWTLDEITGRASTFFVGINDAPFEAVQDSKQPEQSFFGIRFYFWAVHYFTDHHLREVLNVHVDVEQYFSSFSKELGNLLAGTHSIQDRIAAAEVLLLGRLEGNCKTNDNVMNVVYTMLKCKGVVKGEDLHSSSGLSQRQLERLFREYIGITPKKTADLIRFQNTWQDLYRMPRKQGALQDIAYLYRYTDQSHFINNFKQYAGRTPLEALAYAGR